MVLTCENKTFMRLPRLWESASSPACYPLSPAQNTVSAVCLFSYLVLTAVSHHCWIKYILLEIIQGRKTKYLKHRALLLKMHEDRRLGHLKLQFIVLAGTVVAGTHKMHLDVFSIILGCFPELRLYITFNIIV